MDDQKPTSVAICENLEIFQFALGFLAAALLTMTKMIPIHRVFWKKHPLLDMFQRQYWAKVEVGFR
jgi:hypothetical protein